MLLQLLGSGAYGMEEALQPENLLTESITHMWQHVLSREDLREWERERGRQSHSRLWLVYDFSVHQAFLGASFFFVV